MQWLVMCIAIFQKINKCLVKWFFWLLNIILLHWDFSSRKNINSRVHSFIHSFIYSLILYQYLFTHKHSFMKVKLSPIGPTMRDQSCIFPVILSHLLLVKWPATVPYSQPAAVVHGGTQKLRDRASLRTSFQSPKRAVIFFAHVEGMNRQSYIRILTVKSCRSK